MNNKHDANVRKSTLVNFQLGLIVALVTTVLVMEIKSAVPVVKPDDVAVDNSEVETYFNPEFVIVKDKVEKKQPPVAGESSLACSGARRLLLSAAAAHKVLFPD